MYLGSCVTHSLCVSEAEGGSKLCVSDTLIWVRSRTSDREDDEDDEDASEAV